MKQNNVKEYVNNCPVCIQNIDTDNNRIVLKCGHRHCRTCFDDLCNMTHRNCFIVKIKFVEYFIYDI